MPNSTSPPVLLLMKLQCAFDLVATQAASANGHALGSAIDENFYLLRVGSPGAARLAVGVADIVAINYALAANFTKLSHTLSHLLQGYVTQNSMIIASIPSKRKWAVCKSSAIRENFIKIKGTEQKNGWGQGGFFSIYLHIRPKPVILISSGNLSCPVFCGAWLNT